MLYYNDKQMQADLRRFLFGNIPVIRFNSITKCVILMYVCNCLQLLL